MIIVVCVYICVDCWDNNVGMRPAGKKIDKEYCIVVEKDQSGEDFDERGGPNSANRINRVDCFAEASKDLSLI